MTLSPDSLRVCIAGAGAIGTTLAVRLALGGHRVSVLARGDTLQAIRRQGLGLEDLEGSHRVQVQASDTADFGPQDVIFLCAKSQDLPTLAALSTPAIGPDSMIAHMAGTIYGSTETTFYVLAVYFGSVAIRRTRHAVLAGLTADLVSVVVAVIVCRAVFGVSTPLPPAP